MKLVYEINENRNTNMLIRYFEIGCLFLLSILFLLLVSTRTSPLYDMLPVGDSGVYELIGKMWSKGYIPYIDIVEAKGPYIFLMNCLGYLLCNDGIGVFLIQILCLFGSLLVTRQYELEFYGKLRWKDILLFLAVYSLCFGGGNTVEEYNLPFLTISLFGQIRFCNSKNKEHNKIWALIYGISIGVTSFSRLTNIMPIACGSVVIMMILLKYRKWKNLLENILYGLLGLSIVAIPFLVYFYIKGGLADMFYYSVLYNISYTANSKFGNTFIEGFTYLLFHGFCIFLGIVASFIAFYNKYIRMGLLALVISFVELGMFCKLFPFSHYYIIAVPNLLIFLLVLQKMGGLEKFYKLFLCMFFSIAILFSVKSVKRQLSYNYVPTEISTLMDYVKKESFVSYGIDIYPYLVYDKFPDVKFTGFVEIGANNSYEYQKRVLEAYDRCSTVWILTSNDDTICIKDILLKKYYIYANCGDYLLYHRK